MLQLQLLKTIAVTETGGGESSVLPVRTAAAVQGGFVTVAFIYYTVEHGDAHERISNHPLFPHCLLLPPEVQSAALLIG